MFKAKGSSLRKYLTSFILVLLNNQITISLFQSQNGKGQEEGARRTTTTRRTTKEIKVTNT